MVTPGKLFNEIKWATRQRLQYIEILAFYTGVVTRSDVARAFGISDAAATKDLNFYGQIAPENLSYKQSVFGFVPTDAFLPVFADLSPAAVLPLIARNQAVAGGPYGDTSIYSLSVDALPLPKRYPEPSVLAQIIRAMHGKRKLRATYRSLSDRDSDEERILEPHALVDTGLRWHIRAYSEETYDFRDFVLSRFTAAQCLDEMAESSAQYDDDWEEIVTLKLSPHPELAQTKRASLLLDYGSQGETIEIEVRRALIAYLLQRLSVDTTQDHSLNQSKHQLVVINRDEIEPFAGWAFD